MRRRLEQLCERQALQFRTEIDLTLLGRPVETMMWLNVRTRSIEDIGTVLAADPRVRFCAATTGPYNLVLATHHPTAGDLYRMQTDTLGASQTSSTSKSPPPSASSNATASSAKATSCAHPTRRPHPHRPHGDTGNRSATDAEPTVPALPVVATLRLHSGTPGSGTSTRSTDSCPRQSLRPRLTVRYPIRFETR